MNRVNKKLKAILLLIGIVAFTIPTFATLYEDAEENATTSWVSYGNTTDATIENVEDVERGSRVIKLTGNGKETGFRLGNRGGRASYVGAWHNQTEKVLQWSMKYDEPFIIYIPITTEHGNKFLTYTNQSVDTKGKIRGGKVSYGLGIESINGEWHTFTRDLEADWNAFMPDDPFVAVNGFFIKGSGYIDDVMSLNSLRECDPLSEPLPTGLFTAQLNWSDTRVSMGLSNRFMSKHVNGCGITAAGSGDLTLYDVYKGTYPINVVDVTGYEDLEENLSDVVTLQVQAVNVRKTYTFNVTEKYQYPNLGPDGGHVADIVVIQPDPTKPAVPEVIPTAPSGGYGGSFSGGSGYFVFGGYGSVGGSVATIPVVNTNPPLCQPAKSCGCLPCEFQVLKYLNQVRLSGPVSGADFILYKASEEDNGSREIIYQGKTTISNKINKAGLISLPVPYPQQTTYSEEEQSLLDAIEGYDGDFILEVSGGVDIDKNSDLVVDSTFTPVNGKLHLILTKEKLLRNDYKVNILTEIAYKLSRDLLGENYDKVRLQARLDDIGRRVFIEKLYPDANEALGRNDLFYWISVAHKTWLVKPYDSTLAPIVNKVYAGEEIYNEAYDYVYNELPESLATVPLLKSHWFKVDENTTGGTLVGSVTPITEGNSSITAYSLSGSGNELFRIESDGKVYLKDNATLDYESKTIYQMKMSATNEAGDSRPVTLYITVNNIVDAPEDRSFSGGVIAEDAVEGDVVGVMTFAPGASAIERIEIGGVDASSFTVETNGTIHVSSSANFDYETKNHANITLQAFNSFGGSRVVPIHIAITDAVDVPIVQMLDVHLEENATIGTVVGKVNILTNDPLTEVKLLGDGADTFSIDSNGTVKVAKALDYESRANYVFQVKASNVQGTGRLGTLVIRIDNIADAPQLKRTVLHVLEQSPIDTVVGDVIVESVGASAITGYELTGTGSENFKIDSSGTIRINNANLSHTTQEFFNLYATATNANGTSLRARVIIYIDTHRPILGILNGWVYENSAGGTVIGTVPVASSGTPITSMRLEGTGAENFTIDAGGVVRVATGATLDYETTPNYTLQVFATNSIGESDARTLYIRVINLSDSINLQGFSATVYEDIAKGSTIGFINVLDTGGKTIDHFLLTGAGAENFTISNTGIVAVSNSATLNSQTEPSYHIGVVAVDSDGTQSSQVFLDISVVNTINLPPQLSDVHLTVLENTPVGTTIGATTIVSKTALVEQAWLIGEGNEAFELLSNGNIVLKQPLDYETKRSYSLGMYARNSLGSSQVATLNVEVGNVIDDEPVLNDTNLSVLENTAVGTVIGSVSIASSGSSAITEMNLTGVGAENFSIDTNGEVRVAQNLDYETTPIYHLKAMAHNNKANSVEVDVTINIQNVAEIVPVLKAFTHSMEERIPTDTLLGSIEVLNEGDTAIDSYEINGTNKIYIDNNGTMFSSSDINWSIGSVIHFEIRAHNGAGWSDWVTGDLTILHKFYFGDASNNNLVGSQRDEVFNGGLGDDTFAGKSGDDTYIYTFGDGNDTIVDTDGEDTLILHQIDRAKLHFEIDGDDMILVFENNQTIRISNWAENSYKIEHIVFDDDSEIALDDFNHPIVAPSVDIADLSKLGNINAAKVVQGFIKPLGNGRDKVDHWIFNYEGGELIIDTLSELNYNGQSYIDIDGDGAQLGVDIYIYLYKKDSNGQWQYIASDDDSSETYGDGSSHPYDSYLRRNLEEGQYLLAIGNYPLSSSNALAGSNGAYRYTRGGAYQITFNHELDFIETPQGSNGDVYGTDHFNYYVLENAIDPYNITSLSLSNLVIYDENATQREDYGHVEIINNTVAFYPDENNNSREVNVVYDVENQDNVICKSMLTIDVIPSLYTHVDTTVNQNVWQMIQDESCSSDLNVTRKE